MPKNILVAGGAGYIGSHFCKLAAAKGYTPVTIDRLTSPSPRVEEWRRNAVKWGPLEIADMGDEDAVKRIVQTYKPVAVVCFAALIEVAESVAKPDIYWDNNYHKAVRFFKTLERNKVENAVFSSTAAVYGNPVSPRPLVENDVLAPINPYGMTKLACEVALQGLSQRKEVSKNFIDELIQRSATSEFNSSLFPSMRSVIFRYFNAAGADESAVIGEMHEPETHLIANAVLAAQHARDFAKDKKFTLNGTDYPTPDGTCVRDYIHVEDLALSHILGLEYLLAGGKSDVFNLGTGKGYSVREVINGVKKATGKDFTVQEGPRRAGDPAFLVADANKAEHVLGWKPTHHLETIIKSATNFHGKHG
ncbi:MAG: UDP-glucose 4-epimerase [Alphaproteobacteria bacterium]|nr:UDP-glucose 4-epimerase [Alphaproteobacteria bacterium]